MNTTVKKETRWYVVSNKSEGGRCLVEASNRAQAFRRAAEHYCTAEPATVADTIDMIRNDCDVISAPTTPYQMDIEDITAEGHKTIQPASVVFQNIPSGETADEG